MLEFIPYEEYDGLTNMAVDVALLDKSIENGLLPALRLYGWSKPTVTIGRNQNISGINQEYCKKHNIDIVKRPTGGRALLHDMELTYSFICSVGFLKDGNSVIKSYKEISEALIISFTKVGISFTFPQYKKVDVKNGYCMAISTGSDLNFKGKKIIGSAQFRKQNYILQHGSILMDINYDTLTGIFGNKGLDDNVTTLKEINPDIMDINVLSKAIKAGFEEKFFND